MCENIAIDRVGVTPIETHEGNKNRQQMTSRTIRAQEMVFFFCKMTLISGHWSYTVVCVKRKLIDGMTNDDYYVFYALRFVVHLMSGQLTNANDAHSKRQTRQIARAPATSGQLVALPYFILFFSVLFTLSLTVRNGLYMRQQ